LRAGTKEVTIPPVRTLLCTAYTLAAITQLFAMATAQGNLWLIMWGTCIILFVVLCVGLDETQEGST
jgi:predicted lysophospholipase L1 biosynthesis ABC-type transport system permease subunit